MSTSYFMLSFGQADTLLKYVQMVTF